MKYFSRVFLLFLTICILLVSPVSGASESLQKIVLAIDSNDWDKALNLLLENNEGNADVNLLWGVWYDGKNNPFYDPIKSKKSLEIAYRLGSREAQLLLVAKYLFSKDPNITNYKKGVELAKDLTIFYQQKIDDGKDLDGELHRVIGKFYLFGAGVDKNIEYGMQLLEKASELGDAEAKEIILSNREIKGE